MRYIYASGEISLSVSRARGEKFLSFIRIFSTFTFYSIDISCLALATSLLTQLLKKLIFKTNKKLVTFLPFVLGTLFYAAYAAVRNLSLSYLLDEYISVLEHGISVGAVTTLYYVLYEQFVRTKSSFSQTEKVISTLIEGYVPTDKLEEAAKSIAEAISRDVTGNGAARTQEILCRFSSGEMNERDLQLLSKLIIETLAHLTTE